MAAQQHEQGQFVQADFFDNSRGLNITDSPIRVLDEQATGNSYNYEYGLTGGFRKRRGHTLLTNTPNAQLRHLGTGARTDYDNIKTIIRAAGTKLQTLNPETGATVNLTADTLAVTSDFIPAAQTIPTQFSQFNSPTSQVLWTTGSGMTSIYGVYSTTKATANGAAVAAGSIGTSVAGGSGTFVAVGTYYYGIALHKASTGALSNVTLDEAAVIANVTDEVTIDLTTITAFDQTKYDQIYIYRSATDGVSGFTTGDLIATIASSSTSFVDTGTSLVDAQNIPRAGNIVLDNSVLPTGTPRALASWKRRLVSALNSTLYFSDQNKPESWPTTNVIQIPSGGPITGLAVISFNTPTAVGSDELLCIFKENELWVVTGNTFEDVQLKFVEHVGCINQALIVPANGYLAFIDYRGIYLWDGSGKPIYTSRPIEYQFSPDGTLDKSKLNIAWGTFHQKTNQIIWVLSDSVLGENKYGLKMDLRLTLPGIEQSLMGRVLEGVFIQDQTVFPLYGGGSFLPAAEETMISGDASGLIYNMYSGTADAGGDILFTYQTKSLDLQVPFQTKRIQKIIVWAEDSTDSNLTLNYWTGYKTDATTQSSQRQPISKQVTRAIWDLAYWDAASWDGNSRTYSPVVFNLYSPKGTEGDAITLQFQQDDPNAPVAIAGFSIIYTVGGLRK